MKMGTVTVAMAPQVSQEPQKMGKGLSHIFRGSVALPTPQLRTHAYRTLRE